jgi:hypothetical protein
MGNIIYTSENDDNTTFGYLPYLSSLFVKKGDICFGNCGLVICLFSRDNMEHPFTSYDICGVFSHPFYIK